MFDHYGNVSLAQAPHGYEVMSQYRRQHDDDMVDATAMAFAAMERRVGDLGSNHGSLTQQVDVIINDADMHAQMTARGRSLVDVVQSKLPHNLQFVGIDMTNSRWNPMDQRYTYRVDVVERVAPPPAPQLGRIIVEMEGWRYDQLSKNHTDLHACIQSVLGDKKFVRIVRQKLERNDGWFGASQWVFEVEFEHPTVSPDTVEPPALARSIQRRGFTVEKIADVPAEPTLIVPVVPSLGGTRRRIVVMEKDPV